MTRKERKQWEKKFKPFYETREKEKRLNKLLKNIVTEGPGLSENEIYCRLYYQLLEPERLERTIH
jgi:hypothetical protein|tara:strand:- start:581 stop:775 length:195 start_codon:yes stop_codon:yes gene_type:complete